MRHAALAISLSLLAFGCTERELDSSAEDDLDAPVAENAESLTFACAPGRVCTGEGELLTAVLRIGATVSSRAEVVQPLHVSAEFAPDRVVLSLRLLRPIATGTPHVHAELFELPGPTARSLDGLTPISVGTLAIAAIPRSGLVSVPLVGGASMVAGRTYALRLFTDDVESTNTLLVGVGTFVTNTSADRALTRAQRRTASSGWSPVRLRPNDATIALALESDRPAAPVGVTSAGGVGAATLAWQAVAGASGYEVLRSSTSGSGFTPVGTTTAPSFLDSPIAVGSPTLLFWKVRATNGAGAGPASAEVSATVAAEPLTCAEGFADCDGVYDNGCEAELASDAAHCGGCGQACSYPNGVGGCADGACFLASCDQGFGDCDDDPSIGCESPTSEDALNCGGCGVICPQPALTGKKDRSGRALRYPGTRSCSGGVCGLICPAFRDDCDGLVPNGCETLLRDDATCGACDEPCGAPAPNMLSYCDLANAEGTQVACLPMGCAPGYLDCDGVAANGCERARSELDCGSCNDVCASTDTSLPICDALGGFCLTCPPELRNCDGDTLNGCEQPVLDDPTNCGGCGVTCQTGPHATGVTCTAGACVQACVAGRFDCDGSAANGCEALVASDADHCGACGVSCDRPNAAGACVAGACDITCDSGWADCDGLPANGCEVHVAIDPASCGTCGQGCLRATATACVAGSCVDGACAPGTQDCDANPANGCEADLQTTPAHCGACGAACVLDHAVPACVAGACAVGACEEGYADCDGDPANGCERNLLTDPGNCGACDVSCLPETQGTIGACVGGTCSESCAPGRADCDHRAETGCEILLGTDQYCSNHCSSSPMRCAKAQDCVGFKCVNK